MFLCLCLCRRVVSALVASFILSLPTMAQGDADNDEQLRLARGEVVVDQQDVGPTKFVVAKILIDAPPDQVWPIMTNPFEFQEKISPRMKQVKVVTDRADLSVLKVTVNVGFFLPSLTYSVESRYEPNERIDFKRVGGVVKDFKGYWAIIPIADGSKTEIVYSMYVDPGIPVPQWIVRAGVRDELPKTLLAMRERVMAVYVGHQAPVARSILAAETTSHALVVRAPKRS